MRSTILLMLALMSPTFVFADTSLQLESLQKYLNCEDTVYLSNVIPSASTNRVSFGPEYCGTQLANPFVCSRDLLWNRTNGNSAAFRLTSSRYRSGTYAKPDDKTEFEAQMATFTPPEEKSGRFTVKASSSFYMNLDHDKKTGDAISLPGSSNNGVVTSPNIYPQEAKVVSGKSLEADTATLQELRADLKAQIIAQFNWLDITQIKTLAKGPSARPTAETLRRLFLERSNTCSATNDPEIMAAFNSAADRIVQGFEESGKKLHDDRVSTQSASGASGSSGPRGSGVSGNKDAGDK